MIRRQLFIGYDPRESDAFHVARQSAYSFGMKSTGVRLDFLRGMGYYRRPTSIRDGRLWDDISGASMSTEFAISRFLVPHLAGSDGWALFVDGDVMFRRDPNDLFDLADSKYAVMCVKHEHVSEAMLHGATETKMDGQVQQYYEKKNWSSVVLWNLGHPSIRYGLTPDMVNRLPGRDLHRFSWLRDEEIGALPSEFNHLVGVNPPRSDAAIVHHTLGIPSMPGYEDSEYADEWRSWLAPPEPFDVERNAYLAP